MDMDMFEPLDNSELTILADFLNAQASRSDSLPMSQAEGFLAAVISAPGFLLPSHWQPVLIGDPQFESQQEATQIIGLITRWYNHIIHKLEFQVFELEGYPDKEIVKHWCQGYLIGVSIDSEWVERSDALKLLLPFAAIAENNDVVEYSEKSDPLIDLTTFRETSFSVLQKYIADVCGKFRAERQQDWGSTEVTITTTIRRSHHTGRNDLCICGSRKKYKKCCGV